MKLLIHHHTQVYVDPDGNIWGQAFLIRWVDQLALHIDEIGLLLHITLTKTQAQVSCIKSKNVKIYSLGVNLGLKNWIKKIQHIKRITNISSKDFDVLLIRGITPRQYIVWRNSKAKKNAFLFVGSLNDSRPSFLKTTLLIYLKYWLRRRQLHRIFKDSLIFANSPKTVEEIKSIYHKNAFFVSTNILLKEDFIKNDALIKKSQSKISKILYCGRIEPNKGIYELIQAFSELIKTYSLELIIIGSIVDKSLINKLNKETYYLKCKNLISWKGYIPFGRELLEEYRASGLYVIPSYHEGFPRTIWEAGSQGVPVICTKVGGIPGLISDNEVIFIEKKSWESIYNAVLESMKNKQSLQDKICNLYKKSLFYTLEYSSKELANYLKDCLNEI